MHLRHKGDTIIVFVLPIPTLRLFAMNDRLTSDYLVVRKDNLDAWFATRKITLLTERMFFSYECIALGDHKLRSSKSAGLLAPTRNKPSLRWCWCA